MTLLVCSTCQGAIPDGSPHCSRCGPQSLTLIISDDTSSHVRDGDPDISRRLIRALGAQYEVVRLLGRGGFAEVFEVRDTDLERRLAVKVLRPDIAWTAGMLARFKQEARSIARLNHPHTVPIHFVGEGEGLVFYVMPFVEGQSLAELLRATGALEPERAVEIAAPILDALEHAHRHGLVHRDIKPDNVMIESGTGRPMLVDFGIAKSLDSADPHHTATGFVVGTPLYMSPEQALGNRNVDARTDIYAMGAMLFQMLTGVPPFNGGSSQEIVSKHLLEPVPVPSAQNARIPRWLSDIIICAMAKLPADRYASAAAMLDALRQGRPSGPFEAVTAQRVALQLGRPSPLPATARAEPAELAGREAPTAQLASGEVTPARVERPGRARRRGPLWAGAALIVLVGSAAAAFVTRPAPVLVVVNALVDPVTITLGDRAVTVEPGDSMRLPVPRGEAMRADWAAVRPTSSSGQILGASLAGALTDAQPRGDVRRRIGATAEGAGFFSPVVRNATSGPLQVVVENDAGTPPCDCVVAAGQTAHLGYYPVAAHASVRVRDGAGRGTLFGHLADRADPESGTVHLEVDANSLSPAVAVNFPAAAAALPRVRAPTSASHGRRAVPAGATRSGSYASQVQSPLTGKPGTEAVTPPVAPAVRPATPAPAKRVAPHAKAPPRPRDPLQGIFRNR